MRHSLVPGFIDSYLLNARRYPVRDNSSELVPFRKDRVHLMSKGNIKLSLIQHSRDVDQELSNSCHASEEYPPAEQTIPDYPTTDLSTRTNILYTPLYVILHKLLPSIRFERCRNPLYTAVACFR